MIRKRKILEPLSRARLLDLARALGLVGLSGKTKDEIAEVVLAARSIRPAELLEQLRRDELKAVCRAAGYDDKYADTIGPLGPDRIQLSQSANWVRSNIPR